MKGEATPLFSAEHRNDTQCTVENIQSAEQERQGPLKPTSSKSYPLSVYCMKRVRAYIGFHDLTQL